MSAFQYHRFTVKSNAAAAEALNDILSPIKNNKNLKVG
jgi:hypothetical protein